VWSTCAPGLKFANGNVTDNGDGTISIADQGAGASGDNITVNGTAATDANFKTSLTGVEFSINTATTPDDVTASLRYDNIADPGTNAGIGFGGFTNTWTSSVGNATFFTIDGSGTDFVVQGDGDVTAASFTGNLTGNATTATALAADGANCSAGSYPLGVDASGAVQDCTVAGSASTPRLDQILAPGANVGVGFNFGSFTNTWTATGSSAFFTINGSGEDWTVLGNGNFGIGDATPAASLVVGNGDDFQVNSTGGIDAVTEISGTMAANSDINFSTFTNTWTAAAASGSIFTISDSDEGLLFSVNEDATVVVGQATDASYFSHLKGYTADPCGSIPARSYFWNDTANEPCVCIVGGTDIRVKDMTTACF